MSGFSAFGRKVEPGAAEARPVRWRLPAAVALILAGLAASSGVEVEASSKGTGLAIVASGGAARVMFELSEVRLSLELAVEERMRASSLAEGAMSAMVSAHP